MLENNGNWIKKKKSWKADIYMITTYLSYKFYIIERPKC